MILYHEFKDIFSEEYREVYKKYEIDLTNDFRVTSFAWNHQITTTSSISDKNHEFDEYKVLWGSFNFEYSDVSLLNYFEFIKSNVRFLTEFRHTIYLPQSSDDNPLYYYEVEFDNEIIVRKNFVNYGKKTEVYMFNDDNLDEKIELGKKLAWCKFCNNGKKGDIL